MWTHRPIDYRDKTTRIVCRDGVSVGMVYQGMQVKRMWWFWRIEDASGGIGPSGNAATMQAALEGLRDAVLALDGV